MITFPSILEKTPELLFAQIQKLSAYYNYFQIDIADGIFVNNKTVQIEEIIRAFQGINPISFRPLSFEFHLMVQDYKKEVAKLDQLRKLLNIKTILIHASLSPDYSLLINSCPLFSFGLVLNPEDEVSMLSKTFILKNIPIIQIMTVHPGAQGSPFVPESLLKIEQLRLNNYRNKIALDGALNETTIPNILSQKNVPDILCPGSYLTQTQELEKHVKYLRSI